MSYILDALKKSQKQRRRGSVPDVLTVQEIVVQERTGMRLWHVAAASMAVPSLLLICWYFLLRGGEVGRGMLEPPVRPGPAAVSTDVPVAPGEVPARAATPPEEVRKGRGESSHTVGPEAEQTRSGPRVPAGADNQAAVRTEARVEGMQAGKDKDMHPASPDRAAEPLPPAENRVYRLQELPDRLRKALPEFAMTALMYAGQPSSRMVRINGRLMREGEELSPGVRLDEIMPEGVVLRSQGYRFSVPLK